MKVLSWITTLVVSVLVATPASANVARSSFDGDHYGPLVARNENVLRVDSEDLVFDVVPGLESAHVTATYRFANPSAEPRKVDCAFVFTIGENVKATMANAPAISVDGAPVTFELRTDASVLLPKLEEWLKTHPDTAQRDANDRNPSALRIYVEARDAGVRDDELVVRAAREVVPDAVKEMEKGWSTLGGSRRMMWLAFSIEVAPGGGKTVAISYTHLAGQDLAKRVNPTFTYEYLLSPAKTWAGFGPLHVRIRLPPSTHAESAMPWRAEGAEMRADFASLPDGELVFEVMSKKNVWLGMTTSGGYWAIVLAVVLAVAVGAGRLGGKMWKKGGGKGMASVGWILTMMIATGVGATVATAALGALFPERALGFGYGPIFGVFLAVAAACVIAPVVGARVRARSSRS